MMILWATMGGLLVLLGLSIYSALVLARKTDRLILKDADDDLVPKPFCVRFPDDVFRLRGA